MLTCVNTFEADFTTKLASKGIQEAVAAELSSSSWALDQLHALVDYGLQLEHTDILFEKCLKLFGQLSPLLHLSQTPTAFTAIDQLQD